MTQANIFSGQVMESTILGIYRFSLVLNLTLFASLLVPNNA